MRPELSQTLTRPVDVDTSAPRCEPCPGLLACEQCDALYQRTALAPGQQARCGRCGALLGRGHRLTADGMLALNTAALVCFAIANTQPVVSLGFSGVQHSTTLLGALRDTWAAGEPWIALLAGAVTLLFPLLVLLLRQYALLPVIQRRPPPGWAMAIRGLGWAARWSMVEVLLLSAMVATVRLATMARVEPGIGLYAFIALALLMAALQSAGVHRLWNLAESNER